MDWEKVRKDFPITESVVYFQSAAMSPIPEVVFQSLVTEYRKLRDFGDVFWDKDLKTSDIVRSMCGDILNTEGSNLTFVANTSLAMSLIALALKENISDRFSIVSMMDEFPSSTIPFEYLGISMKYVNPQSARYPVESILDRIEEDTIGVLTSYVQYNTGFRQDLIRLGKELKKRDLLFIVNATQAFPFFPIDVEEMQIDVMAASLHKWGFTGHLGSLFYTNPSFRERYKAALAGWLSVLPLECGMIQTEKNIPLKVHESADQYNFGTFNLQSLMAFRTTLEYLLSIGLENCRNRILDLSNYLVEKLRDLPLNIVTPAGRIEERSAIVSFRLGAEDRACVKFLEKEKIYVSYRDNSIRVALNIFNNSDEIDRLIEALISFQSKYGGK